MIERIVESQYGYKVISYEQVTVGAASNTYIIDTEVGKFVLKNPNKSDMNNTELEPELCDFLFSRGLQVSEFVLNKDNNYICNIENQVFHMQRFVEGNNYKLNSAPNWLMTQSAQLLGRIHRLLEGYLKLPEGIGAGFLEYMTPITAKESYKKSLIIATKNNEANVVSDLRYRIDLMDRFPIYDLDINDFTCANTHGDYFISQFICEKEEIKAVIDWTSACVHPIVWEIIRSFVYGEQTCANGDISIDKFILYIKEYLKYGSLTYKDISLMPKLFFYQISVCDYYNQYYKSTDKNRDIYLHQAVFSTKLMKWFDNNMEELVKVLDLEFSN